MYSSRHDGMTAHKKSAYPAKRRRLLAFALLHVSCNCRMLEGKPSPVQPHSYKRGTFDSVLQGNFSRVSSLCCKRLDEYMSFVIAVAWICR
jgi:hypothetical protein